MTSILSINITSEVLGQHNGYTCAVPQYTPRQYTKITAKAGQQSPSNNKLIHNPSHILHQTYMLSPTLTSTFYGHAHGATNQSSTCNGTPQVL